MSIRCVFERPSARTAHGKRLSRVRKRAPSSRATNRDARQIFPAAVEGDLQFQSRAEAGYPLQQIADFLGRLLNFQYDQFGHLVAVVTPSIFKAAQGNG